MTQADTPGYRRRILIVPGAGRVSAELEDDFHHMRVTLDHAGGTIAAVRGEMIRWPWTTCPGAIAVLAESFTGRALTDASVRDTQRSNCTHLFDLALFAAAHADETAPVAYDVTVSDPRAGESVSQGESAGESGGAREVDARLWRNGAPLLHWRHDGRRFLAPPEMAGLPLAEARAWIARQPADLKEPMRILRWASRVALGRQTSMPLGSPATPFATGVCHSLQPETARIAQRLAHDADFAAPGVPPPLAAHAALFARSAG